MALTAVATGLIGLVFRATPALAAAAAPELRGETVEQKIFNCLNDIETLCEHPIAERHPQYFQYNYAMHLCPEKDTKDGLHGLMSRIYCYTRTKLFPVYDGTCLKKVEKCQQSLSELDADGQTVLHNAVIYRNWDDFQHLLELGADPSIRNARGLTPLHYAGLESTTTQSLTTSCAMASLLIRYQAEIEATDLNGTTPLHSAALGNPDVAFVLIKAGADTTAKTSAGETALDMAKSRCHTQLATYLEKTTPQDPYAKLDFSQYYEGNEV